MNLNTRPDKEGLVDKLMEENEQLKAENKQLRQAIVRGRKLYKENEPHQMFLVWKNALKEK